LHLVGNLFELNYSALYFSLYIFGQETGRHNMDRKVAGWLAGWNFLIRRAVINF
jgi:hypothetical protein